MNWMSLSSSVRYRAALHWSSGDARPRAPNSMVFATTCSSGGSARKLFGSLHGASGSAQVSSSAVGARAFVVGRVRGQALARAVSDADRGIEASKGVDAIELGRFAGFVNNRDPRDVVPTGYRQRPLRTELQRVGEVETKILVTGIGRGIGLEVSDPDRCAIGGELGRLRVLCELIGSEVAAHAQDKLVSLSTQGISSVSCSAIPQVCSSSVDRSLKPCGSSSSVSNSSLTLLLTLVLR